MAVERLSAEAARRIALRAQGFFGGWRGGVGPMLGRLGAVQLDTISVLARSHELVAYARLGAVGRERIDASYWGAGAAFEYWAHAACLIPIEEWPTFAFRRRHYQKRGIRWHKVPKTLVRDILARLRSEGPLTTKELGGAKAGSEWWQWSAQKIAIEWLLDIGEAICSRRIGWRRVYDLPERVIAPEVLGRELDDEACLTRLVTRAGQALGVATAADLADYYRLKRAQVASVIGQTGLVPVEVAGWGASWADPSALASPARGRHATTLLSPFDSLVWDRKRTSRIFGFEHRLEAYVPKADRVHGYFSMPLLAGGRLIGRVDPAREDGCLVARQVVFEPWAVDTADRARASIAALGEALRDAAGWVGLSKVRVEAVSPRALGRAVGRAVARAGADTR